MALCPPLTGTLPGQITQSHSGAGLALGAFKGGFGLTDITPWPLRTKGVAKMLLDIKEIFFYLSSLTLKKSFPPVDEEEKGNQSDQLFVFTPQFLESPGLSSCNCGTNLSRMLSLPCDEVIYNY